MDVRPSQPNRLPTDPNYRVQVDADNLVDRPLTSASRYNNDTPLRKRKPRRRGLPWWAGFCLFFIGFVLGILGLVLTVLLVFGASSTDKPLTAPAVVAGTPDIAAGLSQSYLNSEIARNLQSSPVKILNVADLQGLVLEVQPNNQVLATARVKIGFINFDIGITEVISAQNGLVMVHSTGQPRLGQTNIPINITDLVNGINTLEVQPQINHYVTGVTADGRTLKLIDIQTSAGVITAKFNAQ